MDGVGRFLTIVIVVTLIVVVWAILVAPDYDLDDTVVRGKMPIAWFLCAALAACIGLGSAIAAYLGGSRGNTLRQAFPSLLELTCSRLC